MGILNRPSDGLPSVGIAIARTLAAIGPRPIDDLVSLCDPNGLNRDEESMVSKTVTRWTQLGVFEAQDGQIGLADPVAEAMTDGESDPLHQRLRWQVLRSVMKSATDPITESPAGDFLVPAWWFLCQDPTRIHLDSKDAANAAASRILGGNVAIRNNTRWQGFLDWAQFLGLAIVVSKAIVPNPTAALGWALAGGDFEAGKALPAREFLAKIENSLPLIGRGSVASAVVSARGVDLDSQGAGQTVGPALSLALRAQQRVGTLEFRGFEDSASVVLLQLPGSEKPLRVETISITEGVARWS